MACYGYCVVPCGLAPPADLQGIAASRVGIREVERVAVWFSDMPRPEPTIEHVKQHNGVVEAAVTEEVTPVPLRFGQWSEEASGFDRIIAEKLGWYEERLARFAGAMEFGVRVVQPDKPSSARVVRVPTAESGTAYMNALRDSAAAAQGEREAADRIRDRINTATAGLVREERVDQGRTPHGLVTVAHLVARENFDGYRGRVHALREELPELRFLLSGPWVPYSFAV